MAQLSSAHHKYRHITKHTLEIVSDEGEPLIVGLDPALVLERTLSKRRSRRRLLQESRSIDVQAFPA